MARYNYGAITGRGDWRAENQDSILCRTGKIGKTETGLFLVADGMGGLSWGAQVSSYITERFLSWWQEDFPEMVHAGRISREDIRELLEQEIWDINQEMLRFREKARCRCGSTLSLLLLFNGDYYIENMGDSRVYLLRHGKMKKLTEDQSLAAQMVREGRLTEEQAENYERKNVLTMCIGMFHSPQSYFTTGKLKAGDIFLLCSDGLYNPLKNEQMESILLRREIALSQRAEMLRDAILPGDALDNVSAVLAEIPKV